MFRDPASSTFRNILVASVIGVGVFLIPNGAQSASSDSATIKWAPNQESDVAGYRVYRGTTSGVYGGPQNAGTTTYQYDNLESNKTHYFSITAYDRSGNESPPSLEVSKAISGLGTSGGSTSTSPPSNGAPWSAAAQSPGGSWKDSGFDNRTFRILLKGSAIKANASTIQVRLRGRSSGSYSMANVSLVQRTGSTLNGENGTARAVTFGGASSVSVPPGGITSDPIAFDLEAGKDVFLTFWASAGNAGVYRTGGTGTMAWFITGTNKSAVIDWGGLSITDTRPYVYGAELIASSTAPWSAAAQSPGGSWKDSGFDNRTFRILLKGSAIKANASTIQVRLRGRSSGSYSMANVSLVQRTGSTLNGENGTARAVTFGGASSVSVPPGGITSDPIAFDLEAGKDVFLTFWASAGNAGVYRTGGTGTMAWFITGTNKSAVIDWGGLSITDTRPYVYGAELIASSTAPWSAAAQSPGGSWKDSGFDNRTFRILLKGSAIKANASTIQVRLRGRSSGSYSMANVSLVQRTGSTLNGENGTARAVTFGGASSVSVPPGGITSDPIAFDLEAGKDVFLTFWASAGNAGVYRTGGTGTMAWFITGTNKSAVIDWGGLSITDTRPYVYGAELIH